MHSSSDYKVISILSFSVSNTGKTEQVSSGQFKPKTLECQAQIEYNMELQNTLLVLNPEHWLVNLSESRTSPCILIIVNQGERFRKI